MIPDVVVTFVELFVTVFNFLLIIRVLMSYFVNQGNRFFGVVVSLTEPVLAPVRRVLPAMPGIDLAPLAAFFVLQGVEYLVRVLLG